MRIVPLIATAWHWWIHELWDMVPAAVRRHVARRQSAFVIAFEDAGATLLRESAGERTVLAAIDAGSASVAHLVPAKRRASPRVRVRLASRQALRTRISLPLAAEENLHEVLGFELDRKTPFRAADVYFAHRVEARDRAKQSLMIAITVVPRRAVETTLATVRHLGFEPDGVEVANDIDGAELLPLAPVAARARRVGLAARAAIVALFFASAVAAYASTQGTSDERDAVMVRVSAARVAAAKAQDLRDKIATLQNEPSRGADRLRGNAWLTELTRLLPDDTWLDRLSLSPKKVTMSGHAASSSNVIRVLEGSALFATPSFDAPVIQNAETGKDEFTISAAPRGTQK